MVVNTFLLSELRYKQSSGQVCNKNIKAKFIACELSIKSVVTFGMVLYCYVMLCIVTNNP